MRVSRIIISSFAIDNVLAREQTRELADFVRVRCSLWCSETGGLWVGDFRTECSCSHPNCVLVYNVEWLHYDFIIIHISNEHTIFELFVCLCLDESVCLFNDGLTIA